MTEFPTQDPREHLRGPWHAILSMRGDVLDGADPLAELDPADEVDITIRRRTALPQDGELPVSYLSGDIIDLWGFLYVEDGDPATAAEARWIQAQAMAAGLNAAAPVDEDPA